MEGKGSYRLILLAALVLFIAPAFSRTKKAREDDLVRLMKAESIELLEKNGQQYRKAIAATFLHNGTYLISDTALWNTTTKKINCWGHVKVIQDETILTSEKLDYDIDANLAIFEGSLVQLQNKKRNILRTRYLTYNTKDSIAIFTRGAAMRDENGQLIESTDGNYNSNTKVFNFRENVHMFTDSVFMRTSLLSYDSDREFATLPAYVDFWKGPNMLSAEEGWYNRGKETFFFRKRVHGLTEAQEMWADTMYFYRNTSDMLLLGNAQVQDTSRDVAAMADRIHYRDSIRQVHLSRNASVVLFTENDNKRDTLYIGGDNLIYRHTRYCDIPEGTIKSCQSRLNDVLTDAVSEYRKKAAEAKAQAAAEEKKKRDAMRARQQRLAAAEAGKSGEEEKDKDKKKKDEAPAQQEEQAPAPPARAKKAPADSVNTASLDSVLASIQDKAKSDRPITDSLTVKAPTDSLAVADSLHMDMEAVDSLAPADSIATSDTVIVVLPPDTTRYGFGFASGHVKIFRRDIQVCCDSMAYCDLDSVARFYKDPIVWNEGNRQYTADSLLLLVGGGGARKASLQGNAFVITQDNEICFDQIKGAEVMAYFDSLTNTLQRFDALGGASALFYLEENGVLATVNKVESKMLSAWLRNGAIDQVFYFDSPKNNAYPVVQLPKGDDRMKGFNWNPEARPTRPEDVTTIKLRASNRKTFRQKKQPDFPQAEKYFPGYIKGIRAEIAERERRAKAPKPSHKELEAVEPVNVEPIEITPPDNVMSQADSIATAVNIIKDSLSTARAVLDTTAFVNVKDSTSAAGGRNPSITPDNDPLAVPTIDPKQKRKEEKEKKKAMRQAQRDARIAAREARWAQLDSLDAAKEAAKQQKILEKERAKKLRQLKAIERREAREQARLQKYIEKYRKEYERKQKSLAARKRAHAPKARGEVPAADEPEPQTARSDSLLRVDGFIDDDPVLGSGGIPGP